MNLHGVVQHLIRERTSLFHGAYLKVILASDSNMLAI